MRWVEQDPELPFQAVDTLPDRTGIPASIATSKAGDDAGLLVIISDRVRQSVLAHVARDRNERGGLLLGEVFTTEGSRDPAHSRAVAVTSAIAAEAFSSSGVSLRMESDVWNRARKRRAANELIVGWYHSHPGLGAFFSHTDRRTQAAFFAQPYSVGWVLDPDDGSEAFFVGRDSLPLSGVLYCDGVGAGAAGTNGPDTWGVA